MFNSCALSKVKTTCSTLVHLFIIKKLGWHKFPKSTLSNAVEHNTVSHQVGLLESCVGITTVASPRMFSVHHVTCRLFIKCSCLEEDVSVRILCSSKFLPPSFIHSVTNITAFWINQQGRLLPWKYNWVKITPSCFIPINIWNTCMEGRIIQK